MIVKRGDIFRANLKPSTSCRQAGVRPVLIIQNDIGNKYAPTVIIAPISSQIHKKLYPTQVDICNIPGLYMTKSRVLLEQIQVLDKSLLIEKLSSLDKSDMKRINVAIRFSLGLE